MYFHWFSTTGIGNITKKYFLSQIIDFDYIKIGDSNSPLR